MKEKRAEEEESERLLQEMERLREENARRNLEAQNQISRVGSSIQSASVKTEEQANPRFLRRSAMRRKMAGQIRSQVAVVPEPPPPPEVTQLLPVEFDDSEGYEFEGIVLDTGMATVKVRQALGRSSCSYHRWLWCTCVLFVWQDLYSLYGRILW